MSNEAPTDALRLVQAIRDWLREPDNAESFSFNDLVEWLNRRPVGLVMAALEALAAAPASPLPGGGDRRIKSELDFIKDIAANVQRDLAELEDGFSKSQRTAKTDRAVAKMRERCAVLIQCADDALNALLAAPTGEPK